AAALDLSSGCKLCDVTCPSQVSSQTYIRRAQSKGARERGRTLRDFLLGHTRLLGTFGSLTAPLANLGNRNCLLRWFMERFVGIHRKRPLPRYQFLTLSAGTGDTQSRSGPAARSPIPTTAGPT